MRESPPDPRLLEALAPLLARGGPVLLAIEGGSASGKTTLAAQLAQYYGDCSVFHTDDFFLQPHQRTPARYDEPGGNLDRERFLAEVLRPLAAGRAVQYRRFDCHSMTLLPAVELPARRLNIIEGAYCMHPELAGYYDLAVFLQVSPALQRARIGRRNTPAQQQQFFTRWVPLEQRYFEAMQPRRRCALTLEETE